MKCSTLYVRRPYDAETKRRAADADRERPELYLNSTFTSTFPQLLAVNTNDAGCITLAAASASASV